MQERAQILAWTLLASIAGAITALSFRPFRDMRAVEIALALFVGASFAFFVGPWAVQMIFGNEPQDQRMVGGVYYLLATGSNVLIPLLVKKLSQMFGGKE